MKVALLGAAALVAIAVIVTVVGWRLPVRHRAEREAVYPIARDSLFTLLTDVERFSEWRSGLKRVETKPTVDGRARWLEAGVDGEILIELVAAVPGERLVTRIADPGLPFGGTWTYELTDADLPDAEIADAGQGTRLRITEDGEVHNPVFRFMSRFVFGHARTIERYLADLRTVAGS
jgi:uncharacterized protein YndB with AHSA1/START domain